MREADCWPSTRTARRADQLGSTRLITAVNQSIVDNMDYEPFGQQTAGGSATTHKFTGKQRDGEDGLDYFGARYYSSSMGRFMSPDWSSRPEGVPYAQLDNPQSLNLYGYVGNDPVDRVDPDGHFMTLAEERASWGDLGDESAVSSLLQSQSDADLAEVQAAVAANQDQGKAHQESGSGWTSTRPTSGDYVIVSDWPTGAGGFHHTGIAVDSDNTRGFSTANWKIPWWERLFWAPKGRMENDIQHHTKNGEVARHSYLYHSITARQAAAMRAAINARRTNPGRYNLLFNNCAQAEEGFLHAGGVSGIPHGEVNIPFVLHDVLLLERGSQ
ncbi:MAG TPA: RHS repeat-associated core domain-containing protein [Acidobacteriaceae bacterium]|nr:RHS repeat-associated core domain-containing protein [Acidobacteriaceae bacterium]